MSFLKPVSAAVAKTKVVSAFWTIPTVLLSSFMIGWGAEAAQYFMSQGLALAILAWLQALPEFAVEAVIAWDQNTHLMLANLTGSLRLLVGLGWPMIYFVRAGFKKKVSLRERFDPIHLEKENSVEVFSLLLPLLYFGVIYLKGSLYYYDAFVLCFFYSLYLWIIQKVPPKEMEELTDMPYIPRKIVVLSPVVRTTLILFLFVGGGLLLYFSVGPFLESLLALATLLGISQFVFIQWVSPFLSEFPEKLTAFNWARKEGKAPMALMNMVSANINQWTLLVAMMIFIFCYSKGEWTGLEFDAHQKTELLLTLAQSFLAFLILLDMRFRCSEAFVLFLFWFLQFILPDLREEMIGVYGIAILGYLGLFLMRRRKLEAYVHFSHFLKNLKTKTAHI